MWFLLMFLQLQALQAQDRIALHGSESPCKGRLEVYHDEQWGLVGHHYWNSTAGEVVCKSLGCGDHVKSGHADHGYIHFPSRTVTWMDEVKCTGTENTLWNCSFHGWNASHCHIDNYVAVECSGPITLSLNQDGRTNECAGVVQFKTPNGVASVCSVDWDVPKADKVCEELQCGKHHKIAMPGTFDGERRSYNVPFHCIGNETFSWQCVDWVTARANTCHDEANIICSEHNSVRLHGGVDVCGGILERKSSSTNAQWVPVLCHEGGSQMAEVVCSKLGCGKLVSLTPCNVTNNTQITCSDRIRVELLNTQKQNRCYGELYIRVNDSHHAVCSDTMKNDEILQRIAQVVCHELKCGKRFAVFQGPQVNNGLITHVDCNGDEESLWECLHKQSTVRSCQTISIACTGSTEVRLMHGMDRCSGHLEMQFLGSWRSVNKDDWSNTYSDLVCRNLNCGSLLNTSQGDFVNTKSRILDWKLSCNDSSTNITQCVLNKIRTAQTTAYAVNIICNGSQFSPSNCSKENNATPNETFASVNCSGSVEVKLQNEDSEQCWGKVVVCRDGLCGGVCLDTWKYQQSAMLCKNLGCGKAIRGEYRGTAVPGVNVSSVYCTSDAQSFSECSFIQLNNASVHCQNPAYVSCTDSVKAVLQDHRDKCAGQVELFYLLHWYPMCTNNVDTAFQTAICRNASCGDALSFNVPTSAALKTLGLSDITCDKDTISISKCAFDKTKLQKCSVGHLKCTGWSRLLLTNTYTACSGKVFIQNETGLNAITTVGWGVQESSELCTYLGCGKNVSQTEVKLDKPLWNRSYNCKWNPKSNWDCKIDEQPVEKNHLEITCEGEPHVSLLGNCTGEVQINKNESMCESLQMIDMRRVFGELCYKLDCGMFISALSTPYNGTGRHYSCTGEENMLGQCYSWTDKCENIISVTCANAIQFKFKENCGGELQVYYRGVWEPICVEYENDAEMICMEQNCGRYVKHSPYPPQKNIKLIFKCKPGERNAKYCIQEGSCSPFKQANIYCQKYSSRTDNRTGLIFGLLIGFVLLLLVVILVIWKRKRLLAILRLRLTSEDMDMELSSSDFSNRDYEDIGHSRMLMEDNQSKSQGIQRDLEEDNQSTDQSSSKSEYDDVDEEKTEDIKSTEPILPPKPVELLEKVTYEGDLEEQEEYDDAVTAPTMVSQRRKISILSNLSEEPPSPLPDDQIEPQKDE